MIYPPAKLGILGSGQLGRMFTQEAIQMGYEVYVYSPEKNSPSFQAGAKEFVADYQDWNQLNEFLHTVQAVSFEFENIPPATLEYLIQIENNNRENFFSPSPKSILIAQNRILEKEFFQKSGIPTVEYKIIETFEEDCSQFPFPAILKTSQFGYDGKGQTQFPTYKDWMDFINSKKEKPKDKFILEAYFPFDMEISVIYARDQFGKEFIFPPARNIHKNHILDITEFPAKISEKVHQNAIEMASKLGRELGYVGVLGLEFFLKGEDLIANEFAPRPHNSGHFSLDASLISQFGLQLRILTGQTLPDQNQIRPCIMKNILGNHYHKAIPLIMETMQKDSRYFFHCYQKDEPRIGRKMAHVNFLGLLEDFHPELIEL